MVKKLLNGWYEDNGYLWHYVNDEQHNQIAPAEVWQNGSKFWNQNHKAHRIDGPAIEYSDGEKYWFYQDRLIECQSRQEFDRYLKLKSLW